MKPRIINERQEYTTEAVIEAGLENLFRTFERSFRVYTAARLTERAKHEAPNFNRYLGYLERACHAAETIKDQYDVGIGIAKKGVWLSFVFSLYGLPTHDVLIIRTGDHARFRHPLTELYKRDVLNKKVLIFDNDLVTGTSVEVVSKGMLEAGAQQTDLLLIYGNTRLTPSYYEQVRAALREKPKIAGITKAGEIVVNTENQIPPSITRSLSLEKDFNPSKKHLATLAGILGVRYEKA